MATIIDDVRDLKCKECGGPIPSGILVHYIKRVRYLRELERLGIKNCSKRVKNSTLKKVGNNRKFFYTNTSRFPETKEKPFVFCCENCKEEWLFKNE